MRITEGTLVVLKACLYGYVAFLTPYSALLTMYASLDEPYWPGALQQIAALVAGTISAAVAVRAYFDGSSGRWQDNQNGSFRVKPVEPTEDKKP